MIKNDIKIRSKFSIFDLLAYFGQPASMTSKTTATKIETLRKHYSIQITIAAKKVGDMIPGGI